jgi:hypothetical protein
LEKRKKAAKVLKERSKAAKRRSRFGEEGDDERIHAPNLAHSPDRGPQMMEFSQGPEESRCDGDFLEERGVKAVPERGRLRGEGAYEKLPFQHGFERDDTRSKLSQAPPSPSTSASVECATFRGIGASIHPNAHARAHSMEVGSADCGAGALLPSSEPLPPPTMESLIADDHGLDGVRVHHRLMALQQKSRQTPLPSLVSRNSTPSKSFSAVMGEAMQRKNAIVQDDLDSALGGLESEVTRLNQVLEATEVQLAHRSEPQSPPPDAETRSLLNRFADAADGVTYGSLRPASVPAQQRKRIVQQSLSLATELADELRYSPNQGRVPIPIRNASSPDAETVLAELFLKVHTT